MAAIITDHSRYSCIRQSHTMGALLSYGLIDRGKTDDPDPVTGLTSRDKYLINTTWRIVMDDPTRNGVSFFLKLFEIEPKHKRAFPFRDQPMEELPTDKKFHAHVTSVMYSLSSMVKNLDDSEVLNCIIRKLCENHAKRSVDRRALEDVKRALLDVFGFMKVQERQAWTKFLDYFVREGSKILETIE
ncbi:unnamed protein product [Phyllotreta striolata]|uniref:Globin domain-containing protein n=1 Tax=Phyllotreta striolata TaxID=444603 RepID=A0A9N9TKN6_PHYSR|nr:unnamed protein product [Phyllotreta striolata]